MAPRSEHTYDDDGDPATMLVHTELPTKAIVKERALPKFDDRTEDRAVDEELLAESRDDETVAREHPLLPVPDAPATVPHFPPLTARAERDIYEELPSLEVRRPFDSFDAEFAERDPATQLHAALHRLDRSTEGRAARAPDRYRSEPSLAGERFGAADGSGARERPHGYAAEVPAYDEDSVDRAAPPSEDATYGLPTVPPPPRRADAFVRGVQPIRSAASAQPLFPAHDAFAHHEPSFGEAPPQVGHSTLAASPQARDAPRIPPPPQYAYPVGMQASAYPSAPHNAYPNAYSQPPLADHAYASSSGYASASQPVMHIVHGAHGPMASSPPVHGAPPQLDPGRRALTSPRPWTASKTLRVAWFVFGVAFGIGFTFFASGLLMAPKKPERPKPTATAKVAPKPAAGPTATAAVAATAVAPPPPPIAPPPVATDPVSAPPAIAVAAPAPPPPAPPRAAAPAPAPKHAAAAPHGGARKPAPPPSSGGPKALPNSGSVDSDSLDDTTTTSSSPSAPAGGSGAAPPKVEIPKDLFGAALGGS